MVAACNRFRFRLMPVQCISRPGPQVRFRPIQSRSSMAVAPTAQQSTARIVAPI
jgi:hypothetical protein